MNNIVNAIKAHIEMIKEFITLLKNLKEAIGDKVDSIDDIKAIIASASGETERVITEAGCGVCCEIGNAKALADGIRNLMNADVVEMGKKSREYFEEKFDKKTLMDEMDLFFEGNKK